VIPLVVVAKATLVSFVVFALAVLLRVALARPRRPYGRGLHRPDPAKHAHRLHAAQHLGLTGTPKGAAQCVVCPRLDQGQTSTCHAHSGVAALWCRYATKGAPLPWIPSPGLLASCTYADVRAAKYPTNYLPPLSDDGADLSDDAEALKRWGIDAMGPQIPGRSGASDVPDDVPGVPFAEPNRYAVERASSHIITGEYQIPVDANAPVTVALALDAGIPVWLGCFVDSAFENLGAKDIAQPPNESDPYGGGHAMYISGYRTNAKGEFEFRVENSWGTGWADGGAVWASSAWLKACWMLWPMAVA
jgi:hypothetical protein